jgi:hypothetical protein
MLFQTLSLHANRSESGNLIAELAFSKSGLAMKVVFEAHLRSNFPTAQG